MSTRELRELAQTLERTGDVDGAAKAWVRANAPEEAARVLCGARRFTEAGRVLLGSIGVSEASAVELAGPTQKKLAHKAAVLLAQGGEAETSVAIFLALGDRPRAAQTLEKAARVARALGRHADAARLLLDADLPYEAAFSYYQAGDIAGCLQSLARVAPTHPRYREAAVNAIELAAKNAPLDFALDRFLGPFAESDPENEREREALIKLGDLYAAHELPDSARRAYERVRKTDPRHVLATARLEALPIEAEHTDVTGLEFPDLPPLPEGGAALPITEDLPAGEEMASIPLGSVVARRYRLERVLGRGGTGFVYQAADLELGETVALKFLHLHDPVVLQRFRQEVTLTRRLAHPNVVRIFDIGEHEGLRFLTMELVEGGSLAQRIGGRPLPPAVGIGYLVQACAGLQAAHELGIVHRDVKPDNLLISKDDRLKVLDFGLAKQRAVPGVTSQGYAAGTPAYISPEQVKGFTSVTHLSDVYSLGITAYEVFTGRVPFEHEEVVPLLMMHLQDAPPPLRARNPALPVALEVLVLQMLEKDPARRPQSCEEVAQRLQRAK